MSTTVSYKGSTIATLDNETKTLTTAGTWVEGNIIITDSGSGNGTAIITDTTDTAGGTIRTITTTDEVHLQTKTITPTSSQQTVLPDTGYDGFSSVIVEASSGGGSSPNLQAKTNIAPNTSSQTITADSGYDGLSSVQINAMPSMTLPTGSSSTSSGTSKATIIPGASAQYLNIPTGYNGTAQYYTIAASGGGGSTPSATAHEIYFEFSDGTDTTIDVYYDDSLISTMITAYTPSTYGQKTVTLAELDGVTWYEPTNIPLNTQLVDYTSCTSNTDLNPDGTPHTQQWYYLSDFTLIDPSMTFSYKAGIWTYLGIYDENKNTVRTIYVYNDGTPDPNNGNLANGILSGSKISGGKYVRISSTDTDPNYMSLIRTA